MQRNGIAAIKPEFLIRDSDRLSVTDNLPQEDDDLAEAAAYTGGSEKAHGPSDSVVNEGEGEPPAKKQRLSGAEKKRLARARDAESRDRNKSETRGQNKNRTFKSITDKVEICWRFANGEPCPNGESCRFSHDVAAYLTSKPPDLYWPSSYSSPSSSLSSLSVDPPFVQAHIFTPSSFAPTIDSETSCPNFLQYGHCNYGIKCRFLGGHVRPADPATTNGGLAFEVIRKDPPPPNDEMNSVNQATIKLLRARKFLTPVSDAYLKELDQAQSQNAKKQNAPVEMVLPVPSETAPSPGQVAETLVVASSTPDDLPGTEPVAPTGPAKISPREPATPFDDSPDAAIRPSEKKRLHWEGKLHLAPLATVGNLPFRRLCVELGADVTCSEMALAAPLLSGSREEWSLVRRHPSEKNFGIQLAGAKPALLVRAAEVLTKELGGGSDGFDYANVNCGCPIDLVFQSGGGSALLDAPTKLGKILTGMNRALGEIPLTLKVRTGVKDSKNTAHKLLPSLDSWGVSAFAIHGRTRQQRYSKLADWDYIKTCATTLRDLASDNDDIRVPIIGGGDVYSAQGYYECIDNYGVDAVMVGRGALMKPWFFTEIKERREWDISSRERLDLVRKYAEYGLNHWGSDSQGVNQTRRFLCEALSFQHRYVPIGLLERMPPLINERPPPFRGRNELETLLASTAASDWVKISEMFLGPTPDGWTFTPKHKSSSVDNSNG